MVIKIIDPVIGKLKKTDYFNRYEGEWEFAAGHPVEIMVNLYISERLPVSFQNFLGLLKTKDIEFRRAAAKSLIEFYNDNWSETDEKISEEDFADRIKLESISFDEEEKTVNVYYDDADLFAGHGIKVKAALDGAVIEADLP